MSHWSWDHFVTDGEMYRTNHFNKNAWCTRCLAYTSNLIRNNNILEVSLTGLAQGMTPEEVEKQGTFCNLSKFNN
jgi:hypothetical protein